VKQNRRDNDLRRAHYLVEKGELQVAWQMQVIAELKRRKRATDKAEAMLAEFQLTLLQMKNYLSILENLRQSSPFEP